jgi:hypothetical protein
MGTALTGLEIKDTYDGLVKITDNGPISGTLKALSDGLGNDSTLSLSTTAASIAGTLAVTGNATFDTDTLFVDAAANEVGVGTASPAYKFNVVTAAIASRQNLAAIDRTAQNFVTFTNPQFSADASMGLLLRVFPQSDARQGAGLIASGGSLNGDTDLGLFVSQGSGSSTSYSALNIIGSSGNVGIGTSNPVNGKLSVQGVTAAATSIAQTLEGVGAASTRVTADGRYAIGVDAANGATERVSVTANGLTFNGDTAAANALDDYEEGTFSPTIIGTTTAGTATYTEQNGRYTKIGRLVQFEIYMVYTAGTGTGNLRISNLPFTIGGLTYAAFSIGAFDAIAMTALTFPLCFGLVGSSQIYLGEMPVGGGSIQAVAYDAAGGIQIAGTYSV